MEWWVGVPGRSGETTRLFGPFTEAEAIDVQRVLVESARPGEDLNAFAWIIESTKKTLPPKQLRRGDREMFYCVTCDAFLASVAKPGPVCSTCNAHMTMMPRPTK